MKKAGLLSTLAAFAFLAGGCNRQVPPSRQYFNANQVTYDIDSRTGMCYAASLSADGNLGVKPSITLVPATPEVLKQIDPRKLRQLAENGVKPVTWDTKGADFQVPPAPPPRPATRGSARSPAP